MNELSVREEVQRNPIADDVSALVAVVRPILTGTLYALKGDRVARFGGHASVTLSDLAREYLPGDGDCGLCFEWAVHDAVSRGEGGVLDRVNDALKLCNVRGSAPSSILFGAEKTGALNLIATARDLLTDDSRVMVGRPGQPPLLKRYINTLAGAFRRPEVRLGLPQSISGLWKADLFLGQMGADRWVGTTVKLNAKRLEPARGLRIGIVPTSQGRRDSIVHDSGSNLVICPLPYDGQFVEVFYRGWGIVQQFIAADATLPAEVRLPVPAERHVAQLLVDRKNYPVLDVVEALRPLAQPELLVTEEQGVGVHPRRDVTTKVKAILAPVSRSVD